MERERRMCGSSRSGFLVVGWVGLDWVMLGDSLELVRVVLECGAGALFLAKLGPVKW